MEAARPAGPEDLEVLVGLAVRAAQGIDGARGASLYLVGEASAPPYRDTLALALTDPAAALIVGTIDEVPVGLTLVRERALRDGRRVAVVETLFVEPDARAVGVGEAMMDDVVRWATDRGCAGIDAIALPGDRATKNFFESFGLVARAILVHRPLDTAPEATDG